MTMYVGYDKIRTVKKTALPKGRKGGDDDIQ
nr:MAG TPA: hypothetical protein [Caudoviricetes sp.]DAX45632.1 MAG TPA: hypothetical protein [Caudoviricetes sp.]DAY33005.1 MAG TPA: hypothetical protein [Caudoviricetes sp.]